MSNRYLVETFADWRAREDALVLATVLATDGSTYSKAGRHLLIAPDGRYAGLVGGGCLEGDLVLTAREVLASGEPRTVTYDMRSESDDLWGMGSGCRGLMELFLQRMNGDTGWQPFADIAAALAAPDASSLTLIVASANPSLPVGACYRAGSSEAPRAEPDAALPALIEHRVGDHPVRALHWQCEPWPRLLLLGAGPDAEPLVAMARQLGWRVIVADHRPERLEAAGLASADARHHVDAEQLDATLASEDFDAVVVMSHHLATDLAYLRQLREYPASYLGVLGPATRRSELLSALAPHAGDLPSRLRGPVGLDIGADTPEGIALATLAEIHAVLKARPGESLSSPGTDSAP